MKTLAIGLAILTLAPLAASAQSGTVNVDQVFTIRSVAGNGTRIFMRPDKKGVSYTVDLTGSTQILANNSPLSANRLQPGWHVEVRGGRVGGNHIRAEVIVLQK